MIYNIRLDLPYLEFAKPDKYEIDQMNLITCPECGNEVSKKAFICPKCGVPSPHVEWKKNFGGMGIGAIIGLIGAIWQMMSPD